MQSTAISKLLSPIHGARPVHRHQKSLHPHHRSLTLTIKANANNDDTNVDNAISSNPLFNAQFMGVLQQSLARSGSDALTSGPQASEEYRTSAVEEVLGNALVQSKRTLAMLQQWRNQIDAQIAAQEKQVDRMEFALNKSRSDAAYMKALKDMLYNSSNE